MNRILASAVMALISLPVAAQTTDVRETLLPLMSMDCGMGETAERFRRTLTDAGQQAVPLLLELLADGAPGEVRERARSDAEERYRRLADWAERHSDKPHARTFAGTSQEDYVSQKLDHLDLTHRSNALRGLLIVGPPEAAAAIRQSFERDPRLRRLGERALQDVSER